MELDDLRTQIDKVDNQLHDLLMERAEIVLEIGKYKAKSTQPIFHPARQMKILRRLIARHQGSFPKEVLLRLWTEMMGAFIRMQGDFKVAVYMPERGSGYIEIARDSFGAYTPIVDCGIVGEVIDSVKSNQSSVGIIPVSRNENEASWWLGLLSSRKDTDLRVIARLPVGGAGEGRGEGKEAYALAKMPYEETGKDNSLLALETKGSVSISALKAIFDEADIKVKNIVDKYDMPDESHAFLLEVSGYMGNEDARLEKIRKKKDSKISLLTVIGGYAVPFSAKELK